MTKHGTDPKEAHEGRSMLEEIAECVAESGFEHEMRPEGLFVDSGDKGTLVTSETVDEETGDGGKIEEIIRVVAELSPSEKFYPRELLRLNSLCALGAVLDEEESKTLKIVSKFAVYEGAEDARSLYVHMAASAAMLNVISFFGGGIASRISGSDSLWSETEFKAAADILSGTGLAAFGSPTGMSLEIPLSSDVWPDVPMQRTSLLQFDTREIHPNLGAGLFYKLELPMDFSELQLIDLSRILNDLEFASFDGPPLIGGWAGIQSRGSLVHIGFWPNNMHWPGIVTNLSVWMIERNRWACSVINALSEAANNG
ncbi:MAG: hypothetical protein HKN33_11575 [Pyrinomonadaceae bacterium]|nr:hypothetical protein [Pyrinomonadaceae bacterium]